MILDDKRCYFNSTKHLTWLNFGYLSNPTFGYICNNNGLIKVSKVMFISNMYKNK